MGKGGRSRQNHQKLFYSLPNLLAPVKKNFWVPLHPFSRFGKNFNSFSTYIKKILGHFKIFLCKPKKKVFSAFTNLCRRIFAVHEFQCLIWRAIKASACSARTKICCLVEFLFLTLACEQQYLFLGRTVE